MCRRSSSASVRAHLELVAFPDDRLTLAVHLLADKAVEEVKFRMSRYSVTCADCPRRGPLVARLTLAVAAQAQHYDRAAAARVVHGSRT